ncbi:MAG TPA: exodeoxyribonuclease VII large subunit, partial [Candidatus Limnocylindrales bacterium]|nr:exodeoxyribonuclease VII large subunit [Candidatus Limnocylindrales bacterium]
RDEIARRRALHAGALARLAPVAGTRLAAARAAVERNAASLQALGPQATLDRGYAIVRRAADGLVVRDPGEAPVGARLSIKVARGDVAARVEDGTVPGGRT